MDRLVALGHRPFSVVYAIESGERLQVDVRSITYSQSLVQDGAISRAIRPRSRTLVASWYQVSGL